MFLYTWEEYYIVDGLHVRIYLKDSTFFITTCESNVTADSRCVRIPGLLYLGCVQ